MLRTSNKKRMNDIAGFTVELPQWARSIRSCLQGWRYDATLQREDDTLFWVVRLVQDYQHGSDYETSLEVLRLSVPSSTGSPDPVEDTWVQVQFRVAHLEWALRDGVSTTAAAEVEAVEQNHRQDLRRKDQEISELKGRVTQFLGRIEDLLEEKHKITVAHSKAASRVSAFQTFAKSMETLHTVAVSGARKKSSTKAAMLLEIQSSLDALDRALAAVPADVTTATPKQDTFSVLMKAWAAGAGTEIRIILKEYSAVPDIDTAQVIKNGGEVLVSTSRHDDFMAAMRRLRFNVEFWTSIDGTVRVIP